MFVSRIRAFAALIAAASAPAPVFAENATADAEQVETSLIDDAVAFAKMLTADATTALTASGKSEDERIEDFRMVLADGMALDTIGKFMIGEARKTMSEAQTDRYEAVFPTYITLQYAKQFDEIVGKPLKVVDAKEIGRAGVIVRTEFERANEPPIMVDWRVRKLRSGDFKAIDIIVRGVSIMLVKREEFSSFVDNNGVDALLDRLEAEVNA